MSFTYTFKNVNWSIEAFFFLPSFVFYLFHFSMVFLLAFNFFFLILFSHCWLYTITSQVIWLVTGLTLETAIYHLRWGWGWNVALPKVVRLASDRAEETRSWWRSWLIYSPWGWELRVFPQDYLRKGLWKRLNIL